MNYDSPKEICRILEERGFSPSKRFGQNFMISRAAREKIIKYAEIREGSSVWEIGGGLGALTSMILEKRGKTGTLTVFEIDRGYAAFLKEEFGRSQGFEVCSGDMVKTWKSVFEKYGKPDVILGNLPYNSASAMIGSLLEGDCIAGNMVFTVQKEAGERITALPGSSSYSSFSVFCRLACDVNYVGDIKSGSFYPVPEVVSGIVTFKPRAEFAALKNRGWVFKIIRDIFSSRRKTLLNNLRKYGDGSVTKACRECGIDPSARGETLYPEEIAGLAEKLFDILFEENI